MRIRAPGFRLRSSYEVAFSPSGELLATIGRDVTIWDVAARAVLAKNSLLRHPSHIAFSPDAAYYAIKNTSGEIILCRVPDGDLIGHHSPSEADEGCRID